MGSRYGVFGTKSRCSSYETSVCISIVGRCLHLLGLRGRLHYHDVSIVRKIAPLATHQTSAELDWAEAQVACLLKQSTCLYFCEGLASFSVCASIDSLDVPFALSTSLLGWREILSTFTRWLSFISVHMDRRNLEGITYRIRNTKAMAMMTTNTTRSGIGNPSVEAS